jgi:hypothetical protein
MHNFHLQTPHLGADIIPLTIRDKELPPLPNMDRVAALELENELLRKENDSLRDQLDIWAHQVLRYHHTTKAARAFAKEVAQGMRNVNEAASTMRKAERAADKEWTDYQARSEEEEAKIQNFI